MDKFKANMRFCVSVFMHVCVCVGATIFKSSATTPLGSIPPRYIFANKDAQILGLKKGPARRDQEFTERSKS